MKLPRIAFLLALFAGVIVNAQEKTAAVAPTIVRNDLLTALISPQISVSRIEVKEVVLPAGVKVPLHLHPCVVVGVVTAGAFDFQIEGQPIQHLKVGDAFYEPMNARIARFDNVADTTGKLAAFYVFNKDEHELIRFLEK